MRRFVFPLLFLVVLVALGFAFWPQLRGAWRVVELLRENAPAPGALHHPLPGQRFVDTWGAARPGGRRHEGVDIFAPRGTPIRATTRGVVTRVGENAIGGRTVTVMGPGGFNHYYAHLDRYGNVRPGSWVNAGDVIGYVGNTGNARTTPPHLHYGVYTPTWQAVNPYPLLHRD